MNRQNLFRQFWVPTLLVLVCAVGLGCFSGKADPQSPTSPVPAPEEPVNESETVAAEAITAPPVEVIGDPVAERDLIASIVDDERLLLNGSLAEGKFGDYAIRNKHVQAVIADIEHKPFRATSGGLLIDIGLRERRQDYLQWMTQTLNPVGNIDQLLDSIEVTRDGSDGELAELTATGRTRLPNGRSMAFTTWYRLAPDDKALEIETRWTNDEENPSPLLFPTDNIFWGGATPFVPNRGYINKNANKREEIESAWVSGISDIDDYSVLIFSDKRAFMGHHIRLNSHLRWAFNSDEIDELPTGGTIEMKRYVVPGTRDIAESMNMSYDSQGVIKGELYGRVVETGSNQPIDNTEVRLLAINREGENKGLRPYSRTFTNEDGEFLYKVLPGEYMTKAISNGRRQPGASLSQFVEPNSSIEKLHFVTPPIIFPFDVRDADSDENIPCKVTFSESRASVFPRLGDPWDMPFAGNTYYSLTGQGRIGVPRASVRVTISCGPEYEIYQEDRNFNWEQSVTPEPMEVKLKRIVPTENYIAADIGSQTSATDGCLVTPKARVLSAIAEGVEFLVITDSNTLTDPRPAIADLGVDDQITVAGGIQFRDYKRRMPGVFSVFPVDLDTPKEKILDVVERVTSMTKPAEIFATLREEFPGALIQVDDPINEKTGYLKRMGYVYKRSAPTYTLWHEDYSDNFDLVQIMHGRQKQVDDWDERLEAWHQVVLSGHTAARFSAGSASRGIYGEEIGYPRLYIESVAATPAEIDVVEAIANIKRGAVIATTGPFIDVEIDGVRPGSFKPVNDDKFAYFDPIFVLSPEWQLVNSVLYNREGRFANKAFVVKPGFPQQYPTPFDTHSIRRIPIKRDTYITIVALGAHTVWPILAKTSPINADIPVARAISGPVFLDSDGDGIYTPPIPSRRMRD